MKDNQREITLELLAEGRKKAKGKLYVDEVAAILEMAKKDAAENHGTTTDNVLFFAISRAFDLGYVKGYKKGKR